MVRTQNERNVYEAVMGELCLQLDNTEIRPEVIKLFHAQQLSMKSIQLIMLKCQQL